MLTESIEDELLVALTRQYEEDPQQFVTLPKMILDCSIAREIVALMRNAGEVEEQVRGVVRLTPRGHKACQSRWIQAPEGETMDATLLKVFVALGSAHRARRE
jgi:hypothetical protein